MLIYGVLMINSLEKNGEFSLKYIKPARKKSNHYNFTIIFHFILFFDILKSMKIPKRIKKSE